MSQTLSPVTPVNRRLAGITKAQVNGITYPVTEFTWFPGQFKRETMTSFSGVDGYSELPKAPFISGKFRDGSAVNVTAFTLMTNATVVFELANGKQIQGHGLWNTAETDVAGADATFDFKFEGIEGSILETDIGA